ncbi:Phage tail fiber repeat family protein [Trichomonas vaginalis G3]|uniref:Phage tail fiber repeat family protein n=2 Tax=Trichomonas vaginalis (strain ATCC PRA-98 / G3) TaxID=412133 RepID=A2H318_TRIV3|nr:phage tail repeat-like family [Trichomonas vaginalis G3]EAX76199.1 Phage tail fiber repeat family protein [Trichomonas vaginalis G3]KAI5501175.1 phage tail repeat-like family [Trichomonas vaginalis G3]|eukprot:XP_001289129.1 Phage tail fiber repeat family protein [Trichomonas vaginalis G3]
MTDEFLFQDNKNHTVCINPTKGTLNEKPINELLLKADVGNKADKEYVDDAIAKEEERANKAYATKEHTHPELADKKYVDNKMSSEVTRAENEYSKKTHTHTIANITNLQETLNRKSAVGHTHTIANITNLQETLETKANKTHTHTIANITNLQETLNRKSDVGHTHTSSEITDLNVSLEKKADKNHTHTSFTTVAIESIEGTVEETGGDVLYWKPPNFPQGLTSDDDITTMRNIRCKDVYVMKDENNVKFTAQDLYEKKADKNHTHTSFTTFTADDITLNTTLPSKAPTIPPATSLVDTLISNDNSIIHLRQELNVLKQILPNLIYPVGSIYTSMNSTRPETVLGFGTWTQIVDRFLYCANSSKETGGSKTISGENLPAHSHYIDLSTSQAGWHKHNFWDWSAMKKGKGYDVKDDVQFAINCFWGNTQGDGNHTHRVSGYTQTTGQSKDYMPPYMTVYAWYRNA